VAHRQLCVLGQLNDVSVEVCMASAPTPVLVTRFVKDTSACTDCRCMSCFDVVDGQAHLCAGSRLVLGGLEGEVKVSALYPGDLGMAPTCPPVVNSVVTWIEI
jgi:hypothetical protein